MPKARPSQLPSEVLADPFRGGERRVFDASVQQLPADWYVLYGVSWIDVQAGRPASEGEADFVFIAPEIGILVVEVKGGGIGRDDDGWFTIDRRGGRHPIKDPAAQATRNKHQLLRILKAHGRLGHDWLPIGAAVCFPDLARSQLQDVPDCPRAIQLCGDDLADWRAALARVSARVNAMKGPFSPQHCAHAADALKPEIETRRGRLGLQAKWHRDVMDRLTEEQGVVLEMLAGHQRLGITGPAGSGKTIVALRWARDRIASGKHVLVLVPTRPMREYVRTVLPPGTLSTALAHGEIDGSDGKLLSEVEWSGIIVDEAQQLSLEAWDAIEKLMARRPQCALIALYDSNQRLRKKEDFYLPSGLVEVRLTRVLRNTRQIAKLSTTFFRNPDSGFRIDGPDGPDIVEVEVRSAEEIADATARAIRKLISAEAFEYNEIVVLMGKTGGTFAKRDGASFGGITFRALGDAWIMSRKDPIVACGNVGAFIGLESPVVVLTELEVALEKDLVEALYVGASRARNLLVLVATRSTLERLRTA